jgi:predicted HTH domain antitoxin
MSKLDLPCPNPFWRCLYYRTVGRAEGFVCVAYFVYIMGTISARVPDELEAELDAYLEDENLDRSTAVRKLLSEGLEDWRREQALNQLAAGTISFSRAADLAGMSVWDFAQLAKDRDITWVADDHLDADLEAI